MTLLEDKISAKFVEYLLDLNEFKVMKYLRNSWKIF